MYTDGIYFLEVSEGAEDMSIYARRVNIDPGRDINTIIRSSIIQVTETRKEYHIT